MLVFNRLGFCLRVQKVSGTFEKRAPLASKKLCYRYLSVLESKQKDFLEIHLEFAYNSFLFIHLELKATSRLIHSQVPSKTVPDCRPTKWANHAYLGQNVRYLNSFDLDLYEGVPSASVRLRYTGDEVPLLTPVSFKKKQRRQNVTRDL